jgi:O-6-methylguanine DNA methyltransferase
MAVDQVLLTSGTKTWVEESPLGPLTVTVGEGGIRSLQLGALSVGADSARDRELSAALGAYFAGELDALADLPVDLDGCTSLCREVLSVLRRVRAGRLVSYGSLAAEVGRPNAARAVGRAVGSNPVPIVVPCHRVVGGDGSLGGYSGGLATKRWLLAHEGWATQLLV